MPGLAWRTGLCCSLVVLLLGPAPTISAFGIGKVFSGLVGGKAPDLSLPSLGDLTSSNNNNNNNNPNARRIASCKAELVSTLAGTQGGKAADLATQTRVLQLVGFLEQKAPVSETLLTNPDESGLIDGQWFLKYTQPSEPEGVDPDGLPVWTERESTLEETQKLDRRRANNEGTVSFLGLVAVETANKTTTQTIGVADGLFANKVVQDFGTIEVSGSFSLDSVPNRIVAAFDTGRLTLKSGFVVDFSFLFALRAMVRGPAGGWLETTYVDETMRIGRGNRGSLFVLTRDPDAIEA